ncbi:ABC transporter permease [Natronospora cellulosivora (SeqCode)]
MKFLFNIAGKNLFRNKLRTLVSILAISISVAVVVFASGLIDGFLENSFSLYVDYETGHIRIVDQEYRQRERLLSLRHTVDGFNQEGLSTMISQVEDLDGIELAVPRIKFGAMTSEGDDMTMLMGWGVDPHKENQFRNLEDSIIQGDMFEEGSNEIMLGLGLLNKLNREVGDRVTLVYNNAYDSFQGRTFEIVGVFESQVPQISDSIFYLPIDTAQRILALDDEATELLLITPSMNNADRYFPEIEEFITDQDGDGKYTAILWNRANALIEYMQAAMIIYDFIYVFLILLSSIVVINTMIMIIKERTQEIGMMSALGLKESEVMKLFIIEGSIMGIVGSFIGAILGGIITWFSSIHGLSYGEEAFEAMAEDFLMNPVIYPVFSSRHMIFAFVLGLIITTIACIYPARRAAKMEPSEALRDIE